MRKKNLIWIAVLSSLAMVPSLAFADDTSPNSVSGIYIGGGHTNTSGTRNNGKDGDFVLGINSLTPTSDSDLSIGSQEHRHTFNYSTHYNLIGPLELGNTFSAGQAVDRTEASLGIRLPTTSGAVYNRMYSGGFVDNNLKIRGNSFGIEHGGYSNWGRITLSDDIRLGRITGASNFDQPAVSNILAHESAFDFKLQAKVGQNTGVYLQSVTNNIAGKGYVPASGQMTEIRDHHNSVGFGLVFRAQ